MNLAVSSVGRAVPCTPPRVFRTPLPGAQRVAEELFQAGRSRIAYELALLWQWRSPSGRFKVRATLAILVALERRGWLSLPAPLKVRGRVPPPNRQPRVAEVAASLGEKG